MQFKLKNIKIKISFSFFALLLILISVQKNEYIYISLASAILHEIGHLVSLFYFNADILEFNISAFGANIKRGFLNKTNYFEDFLISFSGPLFNLLAWGLFHLIYLVKPNELLLEIAIINFVLALFNLLPFNNFDGGKILKIILKIKFNDLLADKILKIISVIILVGFTLFSVKAFTADFNNFYCIFISFLLLITFLTKT